MANLCTRRGKAFINVTLWADAWPELERALKLLDPALLNERAQLHLDLAGPSFWNFNIPETFRHATEALELANRAKRDDLAAEAIAWQAACEQSQHGATAAKGVFRSALARHSPLTGMPWALLSLNLYWIGESNEAAVSAREAVERFRERNDTSNTMFGFPHLGLALAGSGQYDEALSVFEEARRFGREYEVWPFLARSLSMSAGFHLELFDYEGNELLAEEARELGRSNNFIPPIISSGIDLLLNYARRGKAGRTEAMLKTTSGEAFQTAGWHTWLWLLRLTEAKGEIALAKDDPSEALRHADDVIAQSQTQWNRKKYETLGRWTRARALDSLGRRNEAIAELKRSIESARSGVDPALLLRVSSALLAIEGNDVLLEQTRSTARQILAALTDQAMRRRFKEAEAVQILGLTD